MTELETARLDALDRRLLDLMQRGVPLVPRPFRALAQELGASEDEILARARRLKEVGIIRQIGPIFSSRRLGYQSTLAAFHVEPERIDTVADVVSAHPGVSHNYSRNHFYNLWFTLTLTPEKSLEDEIDRIAAEAGVDDTINLPSQRRFKLGVHFAMSRDSGGDKGGRTSSSRKNRAGPERRQDSEIPAINDVERTVIRVLQGDMPIKARPFREPAEEAGLSEEALLRIADDLEERGVMRRFSAVLRHRRAGYTANGMGCWVVPEEAIVEAGRRAAAFPAVSHCYQRPAHPPHWPYNLFTMIHGRGRDEVEDIVARINREIDPFEHRVLYSQKEYKKERVKYFVQDETG